jgi:hypothetical protein
MWDNIKGFIDYLLLILSVILLSVLIFGYGVNNYISDVTALIIGSIILNIAVFIVYRINKNKV